eukprot:751508_1
MTFINYSISCQTLTGISSVSPKTILAELLTSTQVLVFGSGYGIFILSIAVLRFAEPNEKELSKYRDDYMVDYEYDNHKQLPKAHSLVHRFSGAQFKSSYGLAETMLSDVHETHSLKSDMCEKIPIVKRALSSQLVMKHENNVDKETTELMQQKSEFRKQLISDNQNNSIKNNSADSNDEFSDR